MKKVIVFLLTVALALGGLGFAHAAVTASQDDLLVYPTVQVGDPAALEGLTASFTGGIKRKSISPFARCGNKPVGYGMGARV